MVQPPNITISDVAAHCRVAKSTVSKVLSRQPDRYNISEVTRQRVLDAARQLGFVLDLRRRQAATKGTGALGLLFERYAPFTDGIYQGLPRALAQAADLHGHRLTFHPIANGIEQWRRGQHHHTCDGAILTAPLPGGIELLPTLGLPLVVFNEDTALPCLHVQCDERESAREATGHLLGLGHRRIAYLNGPGGDGRHYSCRDRWQGYADAMQGAGLPTLDRREVAPEVFIRDQLQSAVASAVVTYSHLEALELLEAAWRLGLVVPSRLSVLSLDDMYLARLACPPLSAMAVPLNAMAEVAVAALVELIADGAVVPRRSIRRLRSTLNVRGSSIAPPA